MGLVPCTGLAAPPNSDCLIPRNWQPQLDPEELEPILKSAFETPSGIIPQQALNRYLTIIASQWDAKLLQTYIALSIRLDEKGKISLLSEQNAWLALREKKTSQAGKSEEGGTLGPAVALQNFIRMTKTRNEDLRRQLTK